MVLLPVAVYQTDCNILNSSNVLFFVIIWVCKLLLLVLSGSCILQHLYGGLPGLEGSRWPLFVFLGCWRLLSPVEPGFPFLCVPMFLEARMVSLSDGLPAFLSRVIKGQK